MLAGEMEEYERRCLRIEQASTWHGMSLLSAVAFAHAVRRRFGGGFTFAEVVQFVASERLRLDDPEGDIDPGVAERLILTVLGRGSADGMDEDAKGFAQLSLLIALVRDENLDDAGLDQFLEEARKVANASIERS
jgi:hypothetical protein